MRYPHAIVIERASDGADDDRGVPVQTWATLDTVDAWVQPKSARELAQLSQAGPVTSTHNVYLEPTDVTEADRFTHDGDTYQITGIRDEAGVGHHLKLECRLVEDA